MAAIAQPRPPPSPFLSLFLLGHTCGNCPAGKFGDGKSCTPCSSCESGFTLVTKCQEETDDVCKECTVCREGLVETQSCTLTQDRQCGVPYTPGSVHFAVGTNTFKVRISHPELLIFYHPRYSSFANTASSDCICAPQYFCRTHVANWSHAHTQIPDGAGTEAHPLTVYMWGAGGGGGDRGQGPQPGGGGGYTKVQWTYKGIPTPTG